MHTRFDNLACRFHPYCRSSFNFDIFNKKAKDNKII